MTTRMPDMLENISLDPDGVRRICRGQEVWRDSRSEGGKVSDFIEPRWPKPFSDDEFAIRMIRAKFGGLIPEQVNARECLDLMLEFTRFERERLKVAERMILDLVNTRPLVSPLIFPLPPPE